MSALELHAGKGVGPVSLGMTRDAVRAALPGEPVRSKEADPDYLGTGVATPARDVFPGLRLRVEYRGGVCVAIEVAQPAVVTYEGLALLQTPVGALLGWLGTRDPALEVDGSGCTSHALGLGLYAPTWREDPGAVAEGVIVFGPGYYQRG